jgi:endoglucanase
MALLKLPFLRFIMCSAAFLPHLSANEARAESEPGLAARAEADLRQNLFPYWVRMAPDRGHAGFVGSVDANEQVRTDVSRGSLLTSRILWTFAAAHHRWPDGGYLEMAQRAYDDLMANFWDKSNGGLYWAIDETGAPQDTRKQIYGQAFGIYALSEYARVSGNTEALERATVLYKLVEAHASDNTHGGYFELFTADWKPLSARSAAVMDTAVKESAATKSQNTHLHVMEAYTNLLRVWPDDGLRATQRELVSLMLDKILDDRTWHLGLFFEDDWTLVSGDEISYGHDIEAAWLITEAADIVGDPSQIAIARGAAVEIARVTLAEGVDADGSLFYAGRAGGPTILRKDWWPQAESVVGFLNAWQISGEERYLRAAEKLWTFIETHFVDREHGGWHNALSREGKPLPLPKINFWKCPYHNGRAGMQIIDRIRAAPKAPVLALNDLEYLEMPGLNVMLAHDFYPEGHQGGIGFIQNGLRLATNGDIRLEPTPGQWQPVPKVGTRVVDRLLHEISVRMEYPDPAKNRKGFNPVEYPDLNFAYTLRVRPVGAAFRITVDLEEPLPAEWIGRVGFNMELFPGILFGKSFSADSRTVGIFPRQANGPGGDDGVTGYQLAPLAKGRRIVVAPESDELRVAFENLGAGDLQLLDGRAQHDNGWFVLRSLVPTGATANAIEWLVTPHAIPGFKSAPVIQLSQVGYHPAQDKVAIVELDRTETTRHPLRLVRIAGDGRHETALERTPHEWGRFLRYNYLQLDFTEVTQPGMYFVEYGPRRSHPFKIGADVYQRHVWQPSLEYFLPVQMCHMRINDRYRVWHDACHLDDARMAPVDHNHFDGYIQGPSTLTKFKPGESVPGLDRGGWHDAGDYDLRVESQAETIRGLALAWEEFDVDYDNTTIDQETRVVEIHRPDGKPDILQQIEHGALSIVGGYSSLGRLYRGIIEPTLRQYTLLGDGATQSDGRVFEPTDAGMVTPPVGVPGGPDDRWVFTEENPRREYIAAAGLAAGGRALRGFNDTLSADCLRIARELWERTGEKDSPTRLHLAVELLIATGDREYADAIVAQRDAIAKNIKNSGWLVARVLKQIGNDEFTAAITEAVRGYRATVDELERKTPYGVPYEPAIWGAGWGIQNFGQEQYYLHTGFPEIFPARFTLHALNFILGCHPGPNTSSFASGVGSKSLTVAYGVNRGDWSYIPGGSASGTALIRPDFPELLEWPFLWQQTEYVLGGGTTDYIFLVLAADRLLNAK